MSRLLQIAQLGHPILRQRASDIADSQSSEIQELIDDMLYTVADANGAGIAAPQVYVGRRVFIVASKPSLRYPNAPSMDPTPVINPVITWKSDEICNAWEGCLSIPGVRGWVPRHKAIRIAFTTSDGERTEQPYSDFIARVIQHEYDHLEGLVFLDRLESTKDIIMEKEWRKLIST